ncbi:NAD(P)-binding domain-containing protein [Mycobacterium sp.]|uniref:NAD(P)-binding domain-containing protein n=1 Tax=Mycobacterium sp. TaxID=1785 RepID=UPI003D6B00EE
MTKIYYESGADLSVLDGQRVAVVGYGNQGRSWALNLRDSGLAVEVFTRADESRGQAEAEGFPAHEIEAAGDCDVICTLSRYRWAMLCLGAAQDRLDGGTATPELLGDLPVRRTRLP